MLESHGHTQAMNFCFPREVELALSIVYGHKQGLEGSLLPFLK